jgi:hypothetical protein
MQFVVDGDKEEDDEADRQEVGESKSVTMKVVVKHGHVFDRWMLIDDRADQSLAPKSIAFPTLPAPTFFPCTSVLLVQ